MRLFVPVVPKGVRSSCFDPVSGSQVSCGTCVWQTGRLVAGVKPITSLLNALCCNIQSVSRYRSLDSASAQTLNMQGRQACLSKRLAEEKLAPVPRLECVDSLDKPML